MDMTASPHTPQQCGRIGEVLSRIGDRWTLPVTVTLREGPVRFNQIRRTVPGISQQMLTRTLRALERDGMVIRTVHPTVPPQVDYALTALGRGLADEAIRLGSWVNGHLGEIEANRALFDARAAG